MPSPKEIQSLAPSPAHGTNNSLLLEKEACMTPRSSWSLAQWLWDTDAAKLHPTERQACKNILECPPQLTHRISYHGTFGSSPKSKWSWKVNILNDLGHQGSHDSTTKDIHNRGLPGLLQKVARMMSMSKATGSVLRGIDGNVSLTIILLVLFETSFH